MERARHRPQRKRHVSSVWATLKRFTEMAVIASVVQADEGHDDLMKGTRSSAWSASPSYSAPCFLEHSDSSRIPAGWPGQTDTNATYYAGTCATQQRISPEREQREWRLNTAADVARLALRAVARRSVGLR